MATLLNLISYCVPLGIASLLFILGENRTLVSFSVLLALGSLAAYTSTLRFESALLAATSSKRRICLIMTSICCMLLITPILATLAILIYPEIGDGLILNIFFWMNALNLIVRASLNSKSKPMTLSLYNLQANTFTPITALLLAIDGLQPFGVVLSVGFCVRQLVALHHCEVFSKEALKRCFKLIKPVALRYKRFPLLAYPSIVMATIVAQFVTLSTPFIYPDMEYETAAILFAWRISALPITILGPAYSHRFISEITDRNLIPILVPNTIKLCVKVAVFLYIIIISAVGIAVFIPTLASMLPITHLILFSTISIFRLPATVVSPIIYTLERQELGIYCQALSLFSLSIIGLCTYFLSLRPEIYILLITVVFILCYLCHSIVWVNLAKSFVKPREQHF